MKPAFREDQAHFRERVHRICFINLGLGLEVPDPEARRAEFAGLITHRLQRGGFEVVSLRRVREVADAFSDIHVGCFDPLTGRSEAKCRKERLHGLYVELHRSLGCDAFLGASIAPVTAAFVEEVVKWDGAERREFGLASMGSTGWVLSASLRIAIQDREGEEIYWRSGGIEPLASLQGNFFKSVFDPRPADRMLRDPVRNMSAVLLSLGPLAGPVQRDTVSCMLGVQQRRQRLARARCELKLDPPPAPEPIAEVAKEDEAEGAPPEAAP